MFYFNASWYNFLILCVFTMNYAVITEAHFVSTRLADTGRDTEISFIVEGHDFSVVRYTMKQCIFLV
jgi:hypothetical protein